MQGYSAIKCAFVTAVAAVAAIAAAAVAAGDVATVSLLLRGGGWHNVWRQNSGNWSMWAATMISNRCEEPEFAVG
jgi:prephenate dehydrogenase